MCGLQESEGTVFINPARHTYIHKYIFYLFGILYNKQYTNYFQVTKITNNTKFLTIYGLSRFGDRVGGGGGGGMEGSEGVWHTTVVPSHFQLRSYGPEHVVHLCACFVVVVFCLVFDLFLFF